MFRYVSLEILSCCDHFRINLGEKAIMSPLPTWHASNWATRLSYLCPKNIFFLNSRIVAAQTPFTKPGCKNPIWVSSLACLQWNIDFLSLGEVESMWMHRLCPDGCEVFLVVKTRLDWLTGRTYLDHGLSWIIFINISKPIGNIGLEFVRSWTMKIELKNTCIWTNFEQQQQNL